MRGNAMTVTYRPAREDDLAAAQILTAASINDLTQRHGFGAIATARPAAFQAFSLRDDPDGLWIAEQDGQLAGSVFGWCCERLWFLAELFIAPELQGHGIGQGLLSRALAHADKRDADVRALIALAFNTTSQALYIRHGFFPRMPIYLFSAKREVLRANAAAAKLDSVALTAEHLPTLAEIDRRVAGAARDKHHRFLMSDATMRGVLLSDGGRPVGYAYVNADGHIGPLAVAAPATMAGAFGRALELAAGRGAAQVSCFIPGANEAALSAAVARGMRIVFPAMLMSSRPFGDWPSYLPRNLGFM
jgi:GNAT superfamily N-acetyltransferase